MRNAFIQTLRELARKDKSIFLLVGDLGFSVVEGFRKEFPKRFLNAGVAEANMIGVAAGLALSGKTVFVYSIVPFVTMRCFEQIRNDCCHQNLKVRMIGIGGGLSYGPAGMTHYSIEDIAIMRSLPNMAVICPGDSLETKKAVQATASYPGPVYIRLGKGNDPKVHAQIKNFGIGKGIELRKSRAINIIATGNILYNAQQALDLLRQKSIDVGLISMHTIKPIDKRLILKIARNSKTIFTVEEHRLIGGLGSAVAEVLAEHKLKAKLIRIALPDALIENIGSQDYLRKQFGLDAKSIASIVLKELKAK